MNTKKNTLLLVLCVLALLLACAWNGNMAAKSGMASFDSALDGAVADLASKVQGKTEVSVVRVESPFIGVSEFLADELSKRLSAGGKFTALAIGTALDAVTAERKFQMSGILSDKDAVGIGRRLGAKVVVVGSFNRYAGFGHLRLRAIDVRSAEIVTLYSVRIAPDDQVMAWVLGEKGGVKLTEVTEDALAHLDRGKDLLSTGAYDDAISQFGKALAIDEDWAEAYRYRGDAYLDKGDYGQAVADYSAALRIKPNGYGIRYSRGNAYASSGDYDSAIDDYTVALRFKPRLYDAHYNRGNVYAKKGDYGRAIDDYTAALRIKPNLYNAHYNRGNAYTAMGDDDRAIADYTAVLRIDPDNAGVKKLLRELEEARKDREDGSTLPAPYDAHDL